MTEFGCQSEIAPIKKLLLKHPRDAFINKDNVSKQWKDLNYFGCPDFLKAIEEYDQFIELFGQFGIEILYLPQHNNTGLDSIYTHDPALISNKGAILCNMGKTQRKGEPKAMGEFLTENGIPVFGKITGNGRLEGGDIVWLDERTVAVGQGYRSNGTGIRQLKQLLGDIVDEVIPVPLPHWKGPDDVFHLMSIISPIDHNLALVYSPLMPVPFRQWLIKRGITLLEVPVSEYGSMGFNVLAVAPRKCIMLSGNPETKAILERAGAEVWTYEGKEISVKGAGGVTCLTRPLLRR